jgi:mannose-6-phosphate isomerase-like protein (cupin superfamily)
MSASLSSTLDLIGAIRSHFQRRSAGHDAIGREIERVISLLDPLPSLNGTFSGSGHHSTRHLEAAFKGGSAATADLLNAIVPVAFDLPWRYSYDKRNDAPGLEDDMAWAELIGPEAPFKSSRVCLGLTLIGPETLYPAHAHPAIELYYVVAGTATWTANGISRRNPPGSFILHPSNVIHAMQTHHEPLLAAYSWSGEDVTTLSAYTPSAQRRLPVL